MEDFYLVLSHDRAPFAPECIYYNWDQKEILPELHNYTC